MAELLFANQHKLADPYLTRYAMGLGIDTSKFDNDLATHAYAERIHADVLSGKQSGVTGTRRSSSSMTAPRGSDDLPKSYGRDAIRHPREKRLMTTETIDLRGFLNPNMKN